MKIKSYKKRISPDDQLKVALARHVGKSSKSLKTIEYTKKRGFLLNPKVNWGLNGWPVIELQVGYVSEDHMIAKR
jgi:hypothetical protein